MLTTKKISKQKLIVMSALASVILGVIIYLLYDNFFKNSNTVVPEDWNQLFNDMSNVTLPEVPSLKSGQKFLDDKKYIELKQYVELPVQIGAIGRSNPFEEITYFEIGAVLGKDGSAVIAWKQYSNDVYRFTINYPGNWYQFDDPEASFNADVVRIAGFSNYKKDSLKSQDQSKLAVLYLDYLPNIKSLEEVKKMPLYPGKMKLTEGKLNGNNLIVVETKIYETTLEWIYLKDKNGKGLYRFTKQYNEKRSEHKEILDKITAAFFFSK